MEEAREAGKSRKMDHSTMECHGKPITNWIQNSTPRQSNGTCIHQLFLPPACSLIIFDLAKPSQRSSRHASIEEHFFFLTTDHQGDQSCHASPRQSTGRGPLRDWRSWMWALHSRPTGRLLFCHPKHKHRGLRCSKHAKRVPATSIARSVHCRVCASWLCARLCHV